MDADWVIIACSLEELQYLTLSDPSIMSCAYLVYILGPECFNGYG